MCVFEYLSGPLAVLCRYRTGLCAGQEHALQQSLHRSERRHPCSCIRAGGRCRGNETRAQTGTARPCGGQAVRATARTAHRGRSLATANSLGAAATGHVCALFSAGAAGRGAPTLRWMELPLAGIGALFLALWYGLEAVATGVAGWRLSRRSLLVWVLRDALLPVLFIAAWAGKDFEWRGNPMTIADQRSFG